MTIKKGIATSPGVTIAKAFLYHIPNITFEETKIDDPDKEIRRLNYALAKTRLDFTEFKNNTKRNIGDQEAEIFAALILLLSDPAFSDPIRDKIHTRHINAEAALHQIIQEYIRLFENMDNIYMQERAADIRDIARRMMTHLTYQSIPDITSIREEVIMVTNELSPADTSQLKPQYIKGMVTNTGGRTSHAAIMARSRSIPAVTGVENLTESIQHNDLLIVDGDKGIVIINPTDEEINTYRRKQSFFFEEKEKSSEVQGSSPFANNDLTIQIAANITTTADAHDVLKSGADGIGLYRTEYLYMGKTSLPSEDEQFEAYKSVLEQLRGYPVIVRTLDVGGDKTLKQVPLPKEQNPFLGLRGIRFCLMHEDIFKTQLRALLRASIYGDLKIMFPLITTLKEFRKAKDILYDAAESLEQEGYLYSKDIEVGMMIEVPSSAILAEQFAKEADFLSIGSNDLIQYTMAADRMNEYTSELYQAYHPSILHLISHVTEAAHQNGIRVGICGEMAADPIAVPALLALGIDELSMSASSITKTRKLIHHLPISAREIDKRDFLDLETADEVASFIKRRSEY